jgi:hypothetical protein
MKRTEAIRMHQEEAAAYNKAAAEAVDPANRQHLREVAIDHQAHADMARHYEYPTDLED